MIAGTDAHTLLKNIELLLLDVDGVLTDGRIYYTDGGEEMKAFHVKDGLGLNILMTAGIQAGIVTGRKSEALMHRCRDLGIDLVFTGIRKKDEVLPIVTKATGIPAEHIAFMGDDLIDLPLMKRVGCAIAVADAHLLAHAQAHVITASKGGHGAVREVCESILKAKGLWEKAVSRFTA